MTLREYDDGRRERRSVPLRWLLGLSGAIAAGTVVLTLTVVGFEYLGDLRDFPGPGHTSLVAHVVVSLIVVIAQVWADRRSGARAALGAFVVLGAVGFLLWTQWWG